MSVKFIATHWRICILLLQCNRKRDIFTMASNNNMFFKQLFGVQGK